MLVGEVLLAAPAALLSVELPTILGFVCCCGEEACAGLPGFGLAGDVASMLLAKKLLPEALAVRSFSISFLSSCESQEEWSMLFSRECWGRD